MSLFGNISYDSEELISELSADIQEFGNVEVYAFFQWFDDAKIYTDYDFIESEMPLTKEEIADNKVDILNAENLLERLKKQNSIL